MHQPFNMVKDPKGQAVLYLPRSPCPRCDGPPLRPATQAEVKADCENPRYRNIALSTGQVRQEWEPPPEEFVGTDELAEFYRHHIHQAESWLLRCDACGLRLSWRPKSREPRVSLVPGSFV